MEKKDTSNKNKKKPLITTKLSLTFPYRYE